MQITNTTFRFLPKKYGNDSLNNQKEQQTYQIQQSAHPVPEQDWLNHTPILKVQVLQGFFELVFDVGQSLFWVSVGGALKIGSRIRPKYVISDVLTNTCQIILHDISTVIITIIYYLYSHDTECYAASSTTSA